MGHAADGLGQPVEHLVSTEPATANETSWTPRSESHEITRWVVPIVASGDSRRPLTALASRQMRGVFRGTGFATIVCQLLDTGRPRVF